MRWRELSEHNETKIYLKYFGLTRRGLKRREFRSTIDRDTSLIFVITRRGLKFRKNKLNVYPKKDNLHLNTHNTHTQTPFRLE